jgi:hypothetical protein
VRPSRVNLTLFSLFLQCILTKKISFEIAKWNPRFPVADMANPCFGAIFGENQRLVYCEPVPLGK